jgi:hypothetical protein
MSRSRVREAISRKLCSGSEADGNSNLSYRKIARPAHALAHFNLAVTCGQSGRTGVLLLYCGNWHESPLCPTQPAEPNLSMLNTFTGNEQ